MRGFTLLEVTISVAILAGIVSIVFGTFGVMGDTFAQESVHASLNAQARQIFDRIGTDLRDAGVNTFSPAAPADSTTLTFRRNISFQNGAITYGDPVTCAFQYAPGETDNGLDDNGDGRVDEGMLVRTEGGAPVELSLDLVENGITFTQNGRVVTVTLSLQRLDWKREPVTYTRQVSFQVRN